MALFLDAGPGDVIRIGEDTYVSVEKKSGKSARLRIVGTKDVELMRARRAQQPAPRNPPAVDTGD